MEIQIQYIHIIKLDGKYQKSVIISKENIKDLKETASEYIKEYNCRHSPNYPPIVYDLTIIAGLRINGVDIPSISKYETEFKCC